MSHRWTVEVVDSDGRPDPYNQPVFWSRRRADRYARRNTCEHYTVTVVPHHVCRCGENNRESWRHTGGYISGHRMTELPKVPGGPAPGARTDD